MLQLLHNLIKVHLHQTFSNDGVTVLTPSMEPTELFTAISSCFLFNLEASNANIYLFIYFRHFQVPRNKVNFLLKKTLRRMPSVGNTRVPFRGSSCCFCCCNLIPFKKRFVIRSIGCERATVPTGTGVPTDGSGEGRSNKSVETDSLKPRSPFLRLKVKTGDSRSTVVWSSA